MDLPARHCRQVQSLSSRYATSTPNRMTQDDSIYCASIAPCDKKYTKFEFGRHKQQKKYKQYFLSCSATKVIYEELCSHHHTKNGLACFMCLLAAQCPLQISSITQLWVCHLHTAVPHSSYMLHCAVLSSLLPRKKFASSCCPHQKQEAQLLPGRLTVLPHSRRSMQKLRRNRPISLSE